MYIGNENNFILTKRLNVLPSYLDRLTLTKTFLT